MRDRIFFGRSFLTPKFKESIAFVEGWGGGAYTQTRTEHYIYYIYLYVCNNVINMCINI